MKLSLTVLSAAALGLATATSQAKNPVLGTPGTASWTSQTTATGTKTVFTLTDNTVLKWDKLNLKQGSELVFDFNGGETVVNFLGGTGTHRIDGAVTSNGNVAFFSPSADLEVNGSIIAKGVTLATLDADATAFTSGNGFEMSGLEGFNYLTINGHVEATDGDVLLGGERISVGDTAKIQASRDVLIGAGRNVSVAPSGEKRLTEKSGRGFVLHTGETRASRIEVVAGEEIYNHGTLDPGKGKIFLTVGEGGLITNESSGIIVGETEFDGTYDPDGEILGPIEGDTVPSISEGTLTIPILSRPNGTKVEVKGPAIPDNSTGQSRSSTPRTLSYSVPMSASGDAQRDAHKIRRSDQTVAQTNARSLMQRSSFFGLRGGSSTTAKR
jgi:hypothetical protein